jgi:hypothetical protein
MATPLCWGFDLSDVINIIEMDRVGDVDRRRSVKKKALTTMRARRRSSSAPARRPAGEGRESPGLR